ncbi:MAG: hypothetical protein R2731_14385 [Nocardioides sp.]
MIDTELRNRSETWLKNIDRVGPSLQRTSDIEGDYRTLGSLAPWVTMGNLHLYPLGQQPSTEQTRYLDAASVSYPGITRWVVSEGGYFDAGLGTPTSLGYQGNSNPVPVDVAAKYCVAHPFEWLIRGLQRSWQIERFCRFEMLDNTLPSPATDADIREGTFGDYFTPSLNPGTWLRKPAGDAKKNLLSLYDERGADGSVPPYTPAGLRVAISPTPGGPDSAATPLRSHLAQRKSGQWLLALWLDQSLGYWHYDPVTPANSHWEDAASPASVNVSLSFSTARTISVYKPAQQSGPTRTLNGKTSMSVVVGDQLVVLKIT